jgi:hypothetical protein
MRLADRSRLLSHSRTSIRLESGRKGEKILMQEGWLSVEAAKQAPGKELRIETPSARISVLGTRFDVRLVQKPNGRKQTRVSVTSGQVAMESGGKSILLPANTEGVADEGNAPQRRCLTLEINEMARLRKMNEQRASEKGGRAGSPAIVEFQGDASAVVWAMARLNGTEQTTHTLQLKRDVASAEVFTEEGSPLAARLSGRSLDVQLPGARTAKDSRNWIVLKLVGVQGLFSEQEKGIVACDLAGDGSKTLSLLQFRLPEKARIEEIKPYPIETTKSLSRQVITIPVSSLALVSAVFSD